MIKNCIHYVSRSEAKTIKESLDQSIFIAEVDGRIIRSDEEYLRWAWVAFKFPYPNEKPNWPGYNDWIQDLDWLNADGYALFVYHFSQFMRNDNENKEYFIKHLRDYTLPFWEDEVTRVVVDGKAKFFNVYLIE